MKRNTFKHIADEELVRLYVETQKNMYFEVIYERYSDKVYRKCLSFVKDSARAEDFAHDIFLRLISKIGGFKEHAKFSTWLYSITYNYCMDQVRLAKKAGEVALEEDFDAEEDDQDADLAEMQASELVKALDQIAPDEKGLLLMKYQDDFTIKEIAYSYNITESAVKMRLKRAKERLRKIYLENVVFWLIVLLKYFTSN